jgi:flagellar protein FliO/FliZ
MDSAMLVLRVLLALVCVIGLIWYVGRRFGGAQQQRSSREHTVRLVGRQSVGRHAGVAVVAVGSRRLLVGYGDQQVTLLTELGPVVDLPLAAEVEQTGPRRDWVATARASVGRPPASGTVPTQHSEPTDVALAQDVQDAVAPALHGSILAPATWRQTVRALQDRTVRRS